MSQSPSKTGEGFSIASRISQIRDSLMNVNKSMLVSSCKIFIEIDNALKQEKEPRNFEIVLKWCRLYMDIQTAIDPKNVKLLEQYQNTTSTAITYIIGYLQHKTNNPQGYHYNLLETLDTLLQNMTPSILRRCNQFVNGTIACLWKPIDFGGDIKTQLLALKILATLLKYLDEDKRQEEFEIINKVTNLNLFKKQLNTIIQETSCHSLLENASRELLNTYNTYVLKNAKGLSFYCDYLKIANKYEFFKPLNVDKFWIDMNYKAESITFKGRLALLSKTQYQIEDITLKIKNIKLEKNTLLVNFTDFCVDILKTSPEENFVCIHLPQQEVDRLNRNFYFTKYLSKFEKMPESTGDSRDMTKTTNNTEDIFDRLRGETLVQPRVYGKDPRSKIFKTNNLSSINSESSQTSEIGVVEKLDGPCDHVCKPVDILEKSIDMSSTKQTSIISPTEGAPETPVSDKTKRNRNITNHPIRILRPKRKNLSYEEDDYVPNKKMKKCRKRRTKQRRTSLCSIQTAIARKGKGKKAAPSSSNITHVTNDLTDGNQYTICSTILNPEQSNANMNGQNSIKTKNTGIGLGHRRSKNIHIELQSTDQNTKKQRKESEEISRKSVSEILSCQQLSHLSSNDMHDAQETRSDCNKEKLKENGENCPTAASAGCLTKELLANNANIVSKVVQNAIETSQQNLSRNLEDTQPVDTSITPILRISRSINERITIDFPMAEIDNVSNTSGNAYWEDYPQLRSSESKANGSINISTPKSLPPTPASEDNMNVSDIFNDSSFTINLQHEEEELSRKSITLSSDSYVIKETENVQELNKNEEPSKRQEHALTGDVTDTIGLLKQQPKRSVVPKTSNAQCLSKNIKQSAKKKKEHNGKIIVYKSQKMEETYLNVDNDISSKSDVLSTHMEGSIIVLSDDSLEHEDGDISLAAFKSLENIKSLYEKDLSQYNLKIGKCLNDLRHHCRQDSAHLNKQIVYEITENIVNESKEERKDLQKLILAIDDFRGQMEEQCQTYIKRSIQIESFQANAEKLLSVLYENSTIPASITKECEELIKHFSGIGVVAGCTLDIGK